MENQIKVEPLEKSPTSLTKSVNLSDEAAADRDDKTPKAMVKDDVAQRSVKILLKE